MRPTSILLTLLLASNLARANDLQRLYEIARSRDAVLQAASFQRAAAVENLPQAVSQWLPQITTSDSATRERVGYDSSQIGGPQINVCNPNSGASAQFCYGTARALSLNLSQTLWSYQAFSQVREAHSQAAAAEATFRGAQENLLLRVAQAYFAILSASDQLTTNRREREAFRTLLDQATVRNQTGVGPHGDVAQAQAFYDATEQSVIDAQNVLDDANLAMTVIVGTSTGSIAPLREDIPLTAPDPDSVDEWVASARQDNFDVRAAELNANAASHDISVQRSKGLPTLSLVSSATKLLENTALGGNQTVDTIGINFSWPIFQGGAVASAVRQSRARYRETQAELDTAERNTERQTRAAFRGVVTGIQRIAAAHRAVESGRDAVEASRRNIEFGTGTEFDLLNAQNNYYAAVRAYSQARYDYLTSVLSLKQQAGRLNERDLLSIDNLLVETNHEPAP